MLFRSFERKANRISIWRTGSTGSLSSVGNANVTAPATDAKWHRLRVFYDGSKVRCTFADEDGGTGEVEISGSNVWTSMGGKTGIRVYNERADFTSFVIYQ